MLNKQLIIVLISSGILSCASTNDASNEGNIDHERGGSDCIFGASIRGYSVLNESNLIVDGPGRRHYHVTLRHRAYGLKTSHAISFNSATGRVCAPFSELVFDRGKVRIDSIRELSPEEHEDLLIRYGRKKPEIEQTPVPNDVKGAEVEELDPAANGD